MPAKTFLVVEHNMEFVMNLCDHVVVLDQGAMLTEGPPLDVHQDPRVLEADPWRPRLRSVLLTAGYADLPVVRDFSAGFAAGTVTTLIGGNGAGKSTLMRAIYGTCRHFGGNDHVPRPADRGVAAVGAAASGLASCRRDATTSRR